MRDFLIFMRPTMLTMVFGFTMSLLMACGDKGTTTEYVDTCGSDSPAIVLPDEIVCNHSDSDMVEVVGAEVVYLCVKQ